MREEKGRNGNAEGEAREEGKEAKGKENLSIGGNENKGRREGGGEGRVREREKARGKKKLREKTGEGEDCKGGRRGGSRR